MSLYVTAAGESPRNNEEKEEEEEEEEEGGRGYLYCNK
jgi:hypothetical protein